MDHRVLSRSLWDTEMRAQSEANGRPLTCPTVAVRAARADPMNSQDHRGTPEAPGRVVTLIERSFWKTLPDPHSAADKVWGVAYRIKAEHVEEVKEYLDIREINGYTIVSQALGPACTFHAQPFPWSLGRGEDPCIPRTVLR